MGSLDAMKSRAGSRQRYGLNDNDDLVPQGIEGMVPFSGTVSKVMKQYCGGLQASLGYCGSKDITGLKSMENLFEYPVQAQSKRTLTT